MKRTHKLLSILLALALLLGLVPMTAMATEEPDVVVTHDVDYIRELLRSDGDVSIKLDADAEKDLDYYYEEEYETEKCYDKKVWTKLGSGNKTIDLNGHRLYINDKSYDWGSGIWQAVLMEIPTGASLTVNDSAGGGKIWMDSAMYFDNWFEGDDSIKIRDIFAVTGGDLTVNGGEIHAGRAKRVWAFYVSKDDKNWKWPGTDWYEEWYEERGETPEDIGSIWYTGYATQFNSGTAITAYDGNVTINGGSLWGRGWDNLSLISRVTNNPNGADDHRDRCAALRVKGGQATINGGEFYGRSDADSVQVVDPADLTVNAGTFDVATNDYLVKPPVYRYDYSFMNSDQFDVVVGYLGSFGVPNECINDQSVQTIKGNTMTLSQNAVDPYIVIDDLTLYVNAPLAYNGISAEVYNVPDSCTVESATWYKNGGKIENPEQLYFEEGARYSVHIALSVDNQAGIKFTNRLTDVTINGKEPEFERTDSENIVLTLDFGLCPAALEELAFVVIEPSEGEYSDVWVKSSESELYDAVGTYGTYGEFRQWYVSDDGEVYTEKSTDDTFEAGKYYRFCFEVHAGEGQEFSLDGNLDPDVSVTVNGVVEATVKRVYDQDPSEHILVDVDFGKCPTIVSQVELSVTAPKDGATISYSVGCTHDTYYALGNNSNYTDYRQWLKSDTGYDGWSVMTPGDTFTGGKYYKFVTDIYTVGGYEFPTYSDGTSILPGVYAYVNDYAANVFKGYEQDPARYITVEYFFGICNDEVVENITVENVTAPVAGETPDYNWSVSGNGYQMNTAKNNETYGVRNGMQWWTGDWDYVFPTDTFVPGKTYICQLNLITEDGFTFAWNNNDALPAVTATVNGNTAEINEGWTTAYEARIYYTFTCTQPEVDTITLTGLDQPQAGATPDTAVTAAYPEYYTVESIRWLDEEDVGVNSFEQGRLYTVEITVAATDYDGTDGCIFADEVTAYIDGKEVTGWTNSVTTNNDNTVTIRYGFRNGASAPEVEIYAFLTQPEGGEVTAGETMSVSWQTNFYPSDFEILYWDGEIWDQYDFWQPDGNSSDYDFCENDAGTYRFKIAAYVGNELLATSHEFTIVWTEPHVHTFANTLSYDATNHWYAATCGHDVTDGLEAHHGGTATCVAKAICVDCGQSYGELGDHDYGTLIAAQGAVHTQTELKAAVAAHYFCDVCDKYFTEGKAETTLAALTGDKPEHSYGDWITTDATNHWKVCTCGLKSQEGAHVYTNDADKTCNDCGHTRDVPLVIFNWNGDTCTTTLTTAENGVIVIVANYNDGRLVKAEFLNANNTTVTLTGDTVKVFFLNEETHAPIRNSMKTSKPQ